LVSSDFAQRIVQKNWPQRMPQAKVLRSLFNVNCFTRFMAFQDILSLCFMFVFYHQPTMQEYLHVDTEMPVGAEDVESTSGALSAALRRIKVAVSNLENHPKLCRFSELFVRQFANATL
jgi:hypothetical protein